MYNSKVRFSCCPKSGPFVHHGTKPSGRHCELSGTDKGGPRGLKPSPATALELLEKDDFRPGLLNTRQREQMEELAASKKQASGGSKGYKKRDPYARLPKESMDEYVRRINKMIAG